MKELNLKLKIFTAILFFAFVPKLFAQEFSPENRSRCQREFLSGTESDLASPELQTVRAENPQELMKHISEGTLLNEKQALEFRVYLKRGFGEVRSRSDLEKLRQLMNKYREKLAKRPVREQKIIFNLKKKTSTKNFQDFRQSFISHAHKVRKIFQIPESWKLWDKLLFFDQSLKSKKEKRERFSKYLDSAPFNQNIKDFIESQGLVLDVSFQETVWQFIRRSSAPYRDKTLVLYKVLDHFRKKSIQEGNKEITENLSIAMVELIYVTGFGNTLWADFLKNKDPVIVMQAVRRIFSERDFMAQELGFNEGRYQELQNFLLDNFDSPKVKSVKAGLSRFLDQEAEILKELSDQPEEHYLGQTFRLRALSLQESPFRGCLGKDCSTNEYFETALDPAYLYFTLTDQDFVSHGHITVVLGSAQNPEGERLKVAFVDQIQNVPNDRILAMLEAIRQSLSEQAYSLALSENVGEDNTGVSNEIITRYFVEDKILTGLKNPLKFFQPEESGLPFKGYDREDFYLNLLEFELNQDTNDFEIQALEIPQPKKLDDSFKIKDWLLKLKESNNERDRISFIAQLLDLVKLEIFNKKQARKYLQSQIHSPELSFNLRKLALFAFIELQIFNELSHSTAIKWEDFHIIQFLLLSFSQQEQILIIGEMSHWKHTNIEYQRKFIKELSLFFSHNFVTALVHFRIPQFFEHVTDKSIVKRELTFTSRDRDSVQFTIENQGFSFELRRQALLAFIQKEASYNPISYIHMGLREFRFIESLMLNFSQQELSQIIDEMSHWKNSSIEYQKRFIVLLSYIFDSDLSSDLITFGIPQFFEKVVDLNIKDTYGNTTLHRLIRSHSKATDKLFDRIQLLHQLGVDFNSKNNNGETALFWLAWFGDPSIVELLHQLGTDINSQTHKGETPLHKATSMENLQTVRVLLERGANPNIQNNQGESPKDLALKKGHGELILLFRDWEEKQL